MSWRNIIELLTISGVLGASGACSGGREAASLPDYHEHYVRIEKEAERTLDLIIKEREEGQRPFTPELFERLHVWSKRLAVAQLTLARTREERIRIVGAYLAQMKNLDDLPKRSFHMPDWGMTGYYVAEAELWLERVKNE